jgi:hypothetical protein
MKSDGVCACVQSQSSMIDVYGNLHDSGVDTTVINWMKEGKRTKRRVQRAGRNTRCGCGWVQLNDPRASVLDALLDDMQPAISVVVPAMSREPSPPRASQFHRGGGDSRHPLHGDSLPAEAPSSDEKEPLEAGGATFTG